MVSAVCGGALLPFEIQTAVRYAAGIYHCILFRQKGFPYSVCDLKSNHLDLPSQYHIRPYI